MQFLLAKVSIFGYNKHVTSTWKASLGYLLAIITCDAGMEVLDLIIASNVQGPRWTPEFTVNFTVQKFAV